MADVDVKKGEGAQKTGSREMERARGQQLGRREGYYPGIFFPSPSEFFMSSPFSLMRRISDEMDRMFSGGSGGERQPGENSPWMPAIEVTEKENNFQVCAELPGLKPEDVRLEVTEDTLVIQGERRREQTSEEAGIRRSERVYGRFYREIPLPPGARTDNANADFRDGLLEIRIPVEATQSKRRQIPVRTGGESGTQTGRQAQNTEAQQPKTGGQTYRSGGSGA